MLALNDEDAKSRMTALGITLPAVNEQPRGRFTMLKDPDGNGLILTRMTAPEEIRTR